MRFVRALVLLLTLTALCLPAAAAAQQDPPHGGDNPPALQGAPPTQGNGEDAEPAGEPGAAADDARGGPQLPATGGEAGLIGLVGAGMVMMGFGLRLRLPGA